MEIAVWELLCQEWEVKFVHFYRGSNRVTDGMTSLVINDQLDLYVVLNPLMVFCQNCTMAIWKLHSNI